MSYLLESLSRGLLSGLLEVFSRQIPEVGEPRAALEQRRVQSPTSADVANRCGVANLRDLRLREARRAFEAALAIDASNQVALLGLACVHDARGQMQDAEQTLARARANDAGDPAVAFGIGLCRERRGNATGAAAAYRRAVELCPRLRNAAERLAAMAMRRGDWEAAVGHYERLAALEPGDVDVLLTAGCLQLRVERPQQAVETFQQALLIEPEAEPDATVGAADRTDASELDHAITTLESLVERYPGVTEFRVHLADLYAKAGDDQNAVAQYHAALDLHPTFLEATVKLGTQHLRRERYADAAHSFVRAAELNDRLLVAFVGLGVAQRAANCRSDADATFELAGSLAPNSTLLFTESTRLALKTERRPRAAVFALPDDDPYGEDVDELLVEALRRYERTIQTRPRDASLRYRHGLLLRQLGRIDGAAQAFREAVASNPSYVKALIQLGIALREAGDEASAIEVFERVITPDAATIEMHYQLAMLYLQRSQFDLAVEQFERSVGESESERGVRETLALALQNAGMLDRATTTWNAICELSAGSEYFMGQPRFASRGLLDEE